MECYDRIMKAESLNIDIMNFIQNKLEELGYSDIELEKEYHKVINDIQLLKNAQVDFIRALSEHENIIKQNGK